MPLCLICRGLAGYQMLHAADWLKPGGELVYSVCSLEPEEKLMKRLFAAVVMVVAGAAGKAPSPALPAR